MPGLAARTTPAMPYAFLVTSPGANGSLGAAKSSSLKVAGKRTPRPDGVGTV